MGNGIDCPGVGWGVGYTGIIPLVYIRHIAYFLSPLIFSIFVRMEKRVVPKGLKTDFADEKMQEILLMVDDNSYIKYVGRSGYGVLLDKGVDIEGVGIRVVRGYVEVFKRLGSSQKMLGRYLLGIGEKDFYCDHINRNPLDNRMSNLRVASRQQNMWNRDVFTGKMSNQYKGVYTNGEGVYVSTMVSGVLHEVNFNRAVAEEVSASIADRLYETLHNGFGAYNFRDRLDMTLRDYIDEVLISKNIKRTTKNQL